LIKGGKYDRRSRGYERPHVHVPKTISIHIYMCRTHYYLERIGWV
jgi:hypothetical protein